jgi:hypothetical protein
VIEANDDAVETDETYEPDDDRVYPRSAKDIKPHEMMASLNALAGFGDNHWLAMQGHQLAMVDTVLNDMEAQVCRQMYDDEDRPVETMALLGALSPMWIYAAYELLRTWRQRCDEVIRLAANGGLDQRADNLTRERSYNHYDRQLRADQLREARDNPALVQRMKDDLARTEMGFTVIEFIRVALAKHEVSGSKNRNKPIAFAPGMARPNRYTGSMEYEMSAGGAIIDYRSRRDLADTIRALPSIPVPTADDLEGFRAYMKPPEMG